MKPAYWDRACAELARADRRLARIIDASGPVHLVSRGDPFQTLARSIVGQQISLKAAQTVWDRLETAAREVTPLRLSRMRETTLRNCGLSQRKVEYVRDLARGFAGGAIDPARWASLDDESVIEELVSVRGIGRWTAEMFLIFNLLRPDVYPLDDVGLLRAIVTHYGDDALAAEKTTGRAVREHASRVGERFRPWRSVATWYLWRSLDPIPVEY